MAVELTTELISFLDKHEFTKKELKDTEYISDTVSNYPDYFGGPEISDIDSLDLAKQYSKLKLKN